MMPPIVPAVKSLYICERHVGAGAASRDLLRLFNALRPTVPYPHESPPFCVYAQLLNGHGRVPVQIHVTDGSTDEAIWKSSVRHLEFPDRLRIVHLAWTIQVEDFPHPGVYFVELFCNNSWVADTKLELLETEE